jgi:hypothetical protein
MLLREIIIPKKTSVTLRLPQAMVGKTIELIAFEIEANENKQTPEQYAKQIDDLTKDSLVDLSGFVFNRTEANNYDA